MENVYTIITLISLLVEIIALIATLLKCKEKIVRFLVIVGALIYASSIVLYAIK